MVVGISVGCRSGTGVLLLNKYGVNSSTEIGMVSIARFKKNQRALSTGKTIARIR